MFTDEQFRLKMRAIMSNLSREVRLSMQEERENEDEIIACDLLKEISGKVTDEVYAKFFETNENEPDVVAFVQEKRNLLPESEVVEIVRTVSDYWERKVSRYIPSNVHEEIKETIEESTKGGKRVC